MTTEPGAPLRVRNRTVAQSSVATGVEDPFLTAYKEGSFHYLLIAADRI